MLLNLRLITLKLICFNRKTTFLVKHECENCYKDTLLYSSSMSGNPENLVRTSSYLLQLIKFALYADDILVIYTPDND